MKAVIVAGGRGERLRPLTDTIPKPMLEVGGKPILEHIIKQLKDAGVNEFIVCLCYLPEKITSYFGDGAKLGIKILYVYEDPKKPLGTAGAVKEAWSYINDTCIVTYADVFRTISIRAMTEIHNQKGGLGTIAVYENMKSDPKSMILFDTDKRITSFVERPNREELTGKIWSNGSLYIVEPDILNWIPAHQQSDFGKDIFPLLLNRGQQLYVYECSGQVIDIGNSEKLEYARNVFLR